jgi:hypothetical protein
VRSDNPLALARHNPFFQISGPRNVLLSANSYSADVKYKMEFRSREVIFGREEVSSAEEDAAGLDLMQVILRELLPPRRYYKSRHPSSGGIIFDIGETCTCLVSRCNATNNLTHSNRRFLLLTFVFYSIFFSK